MMTGRDWAVILFAFGLATCAIILCLTIATHPILLASTGMTAVGSLLGVMVGVVATYIGRRAP